MIVISFKVDKELAETIEKYIKEKNITKSELIRKALEMYLNKNHKKPFKTKRITIY
jgi:metal-responsive CopG/Arc/MetJ family transcriptional regulator